MLHHESGVMPEFDERREIWRLLTLASTKQRINWLKWCCEQISSPAAETKVLQNDGSIGSVFWDSMSLFFGSHLSMERAGTKLVAMVNGRS